MTIKHLLLLSCLLGLTAWAAHSQPLGFDAQNNLNSVGTAGYNPNSNVRVYDNRYQGVKGTPCLFDKWYPADIFLSENSRYQSVPVKFDIFKEPKLVAKRQAGDSIILDSEQVQSFIIHNQDTDTKHTFKKVALAQGKKSEFLEVLYEGKTALYAKRSKNFSPADFKGGYSAGKYYDEYLSVETDLYLKTEQGGWEKIKSNKKALLKALKNKEKELEDFIKKEGIEFKTEADLAKVIKHYDSL